MTRKLKRRKVIYPPNLNLDDPVRKYCQEKRYAPHIIIGGLEGLILRWEKLAEQLTQGYLGMVYEYTNAMDSRRILGEVLSNVPEVHFTCEILNRIKQADAEFLKLTVSVDECIVSEKYAKRLQLNKDTNWWYYRLPKDKGPNW